MSFFLSALSRGLLIIQRETLISRSRRCKNPFLLLAYPFVDTVLVYTCQKAQPKRCDFFLWDDEAKPREAAAVFNNSRTEPLPLPKTPTKSSPYGLATPQTSSRFRTSSPEVTTLYTPSKSSRRAPLSSGQKIGTQASTTQGSASEEEFYDWPASDDGELSKVTDQASSGHSIRPPETPRKAIRTDLLSTPGKRRYDEMTVESETNMTTSLPTPATRGRIGDDIFTTPTAGSPGKGLFAVGIMPSPAETPTPLRYKETLLTQEFELAAEVLNVLRNHNVLVPSETADAVKVVCNKHVLYTRGVTRGRDVSRTVVKSKDERIAELLGEIEGLKAERETSRAVIRHLRRDAAVRREERD